MTSSVLTSMRKTTQYFSGKLKLLHKTTTMEWFDIQFRLTKSGGNDEAKVRQPQNCFQYASREEIDRKMMLGEVLSAFTFHGNPNKIIVLFGESKHRGLLNIIGITRFDIGRARKCLGLLM